MADNRTFLVPSTTRTRKHQSNAAWYTQIWISDARESNISVHEANSNERYACQRMMKLFDMEEDVKLMSERCRVKDCITGGGGVWRRSRRWRIRWKKKWVKSRSHENLLADIDSAHRCMHTDAKSKNFSDYHHEIAPQKANFTFTLRTCMWTVIWNNVKTFKLCAKTAWMLIRKSASSNLHLFTHSFIHNCYIDAWTIL
jgi:hypothetical protein